MGVSLILLRRARTGIALSRCGWVCVYAPMWPGTSFLGYPFLDLRPEKWVDGWVDGWVGGWVVGWWLGCGGISRRGEEHPVQSIINDDECAHKVKKTDLCYSDCVKAS